MINNIDNIVGFFGTWRAPRGDPLYQFAFECGRRAAQQGMAILTGGYTGIMEAPLAGARSTGTQLPLIGYTWTGLDSILKPNDFLTLNKSFDSECQRVAALVEESDICVFFPGRTGTLAELALAVERHAKGAMRSPILLATDYWVSFFDWLDGSNARLGLTADEPTGHSPYRIINSPDDFECFLKNEYPRA